MTINDEILNKEKYVCRGFENAAGGLIANVAQACFQLEGAGANNEVMRRYGAMVSTTLERIVETIKETLYAYECLEEE